MKHSHLLAIALAVQSGLALLCAQSTVTLAPVASPSAAQPGVTTVSLTGSGFPSGTILPQDVLITLAVAGQPGVKSSMAPAVFAASAVQPLFGTSERVTFTIPAGTFIVASPTSCQVSIAGSTTGSVQFTSGNTASLTVNPAATISLSPASGDPGQSEPVTITGLYTNFLQGSTVASFGPSISVGGAAAGQFGPVTVTSASTATAQLTIGSSAASGVQWVQVATGTQVATSNSFTITAALAITTSSPLPAGTVGVTYSQTLAATGGSGHYTWSVTGGALPAGLSLTAATGAISGQPTAAGASNFTIQVTDSNNAKATKAFALTIDPALSITTSSPLPAGTVGVTYSQTLAATGGSGHYTWSVTGGALPAGLSLTAATGAISGQPTAAGASNFTIQVTDSNNAKATKAFALTIDPALSITTSSPLPAGTVGVTYSQTLAATGGSGHYTWSVTGGALPAGLSLTAATGAISGQPTAAGASNFTIQVKDSNNAMAAKAFAITINGGPQILSVAPNAGNAGLSLQVTITGANTSFVQGTTQASFGPGISVGGATAGSFGPVTVNSTSSATAAIVISASAATGSQTVTVATGTQQASLTNGFSVEAAIPYISVDTTTTAPLAPGFSGFDDEYVLNGVEYWDPKYIPMVQALKPGWVRYPAGTPSMGFNWQTGYEVPAWITQLQPVMISEAYNALLKAQLLTQAKCGAEFSKYGTFLQTLGANGVVAFNGYTDTNLNSAGEMVTAARSGGMNIVEWELGNEPYIYPKIFPTPAAYAAAQHSPYYLNMTSADPQVTAGLFYQGQFSFQAGNYVAWDSGMAAYSPKYWEAASFHVYPITDTSIGTSDEEMTLNGVLAHGTTEYFNSYILPLVGPNLPVYFTELNSGPATMPFETSIYNGIFLAEYIARMSTIPQVKAVGATEIYLGNSFTEGIIRAVDDFEPYLIAHVVQNPNYCTDTSTNPDTQFSFYFSTSGLALQIANTAINGSDATWPTTLTGGPTVPILGYDGNPVPAIFAQGYQGTDGTHYLLITNKSAAPAPVAIEVNGSLLEETVMVSYISNASDLAENTATDQNNVQIVNTTSPNPITVGPYSVTRVQW